ncbi:MAG: response regulator [Bradyrhizobium sp.]
MTNFVTLLVEDDPLQREVIAEILQAEGFEVIQCSSAEAAELVVAQSGPELRALIADNHLAGQMTGMELATYAKSRQPHMTAIVMSGQPLSVQSPEIDFLLKPFPAARLIEALG